MLSKTSGSMQNELLQRDQEIIKLNKRITELEKELMKVRKEKEDESDRFAKEKAKFEQRIKELED